MPDRSPEEREAARIAREQRRAGRKGTPAPPPAPDERESDPRIGGDVHAHQPTQQFDVASEWTEEHATVAAPPAPEPEVPLGTKRVAAHERLRQARAAPAPRASRRPGRRVLPFLAFLLILLAGWFLNALYQPFAGEGEGRVAVKVPRGATVGEIADLLADRGVIGSTFFFELRAKLGGRAEDIKSGSFTLRRDMSYAAALDALSENPAPPPVLRVTIPEGRSRGETAPVARAAGVRGDYRAASRRSPVLDPRRYGAPKGATLEGFLFPATYELKRRATAQDLVAAQLTAFKRNLETVDLGYARSKNLTVYDVLIIASMVEREVAVAKERPLVAAVIYNRLRDGMYLGIDATLRYGLNQWTEPLKVSELESDTPYNTRNHLGLPPGPIGNPGLASIQAAARPARVDYRFYVVKPGTCGEHAFSADDAQFARDVAAYDAAREAAGGKSPTTC
jgi:uncharacterized YceG family protein